MRRLAADLGLIVLCVGLGAVCGWAADQANRRPEELALDRRLTRLEQEADSLHRSLVELPQACRLPVASPDTAR